MSRYVGIDLHRRRSVVVILDSDGTRVSSTRIENSPMNLAAAVAEAGPEPEVVLEATWGWYWAADVIEEAGGWLLRDVRLFDLYRGEQIATGKKSLAYGLTFQADNRTLTEKDANKIRSKIVRRLLDQLGATLRT